MSKGICLVMAGAWLVLTSCTMIPKYERPNAPIASTWPGDSNAPAGEKELLAADIGWHDFFKDQRLQQIVALALENNRDLRVAILNVEATRAQYRIASSALVPDVDLNGAFTRQRFPATLPRGGGVGGQPETISQYTVGLGTTSYEIDLFGRIRSLRRQVLEQYFATDEARVAAHLSLVGEVANQYYLERESDELRANSERTLESVSAYYRLIKTSFDLGNASELDVHSAEAQMEAARANIAAFTRQAAQARNGLELLVGQTLPEDLPAPAPLSTEQLLPDLPAGLPSDLLIRRPDIRAAEHFLLAANANIGAARAAFFPRVSLTASAGFSSTDVASLFSSGSRTWLFSPQITVPIFEAGYHKANLDLSEVRKRIEIARYEQAIQTAFREVADALAGRATFGEQLDAEARLVDAERKRYNLADIRYRSGVDSYLSVLLAQQALYLAEQRLVQSRYAELANLISLYKALGGGWED